MTEGESFECRYFATYSGIKLPLNLVGPIAEAALANRNTFMRAFFDAAGKLRLCEKIVYGEVEMAHRYQYDESGKLTRAEVQMPDEAPAVLDFEDENGAKPGEETKAAVSPDPTGTPFSRIGGTNGVDRLVEAFYARMDRLPEARSIRAMHASDLSATKEVLKRYLGEWMGGPKLYSEERGHPRLRMRHIRFKIGEAERDAWLLCMGGALEEAVDDPALREELYLAFAKLADWMRNDPDNPHDR